MLACSTFTPVASCHGDLTLENVVWVRMAPETPIEYMMYQMDWQFLTGEKGLPPEGRFVFLDPGHSRGLPCRENDEAKLLQALEELDEGHWRDKPCSGEIAHWYVTKMASLPHRVLLASHFLRLLRHAAKHKSWRVEHARRRLQELTE
jgi:hypothetical protein